MKFPPFVAAARSLCLSLTLCLSLLLCATASQAQSMGPKSVWNVQEQGGFVMSSLCDAQGKLWFGTEDKGVWQFDPATQQWTNFTTKDGLGDDNGYALAQDWLGRIWVGHQSHGVSVYNGENWHNYDVLQGPLGERVFDMAISPKDGSVWIGTNKGLASYDLNKNTWTYDGRMTGLPSDQIQALAFAKDGTLFVGTQCDGLAVGSPKNNYTKWQIFTGPGEMPLFQTGDGLPSDFINDILVGRDGTVYVATGYGLARSDDNGQSWSYLRGKDWKAKLEGRTFPPQIPPQKDRDLLLEDYVTTLAEDSDGSIWLGHPREGVEMRSQGADFLGGGGVVGTPDEQLEQQRQQKADAERQALEEAAANGARLPNGVPFRNILPQNDQPSPPQNWQDKLNALDQQERTDYVNSILTLPGAPPLVCGGGSGVVQLGEALTASGKLPKTTNLPAIAPLPLPAAPPTLAELQEFLKRVQALKKPWNRVDAAYLGEDWKTQGDWVGRYGMRYAMLCAMQAPLEQFVINDLSYHVEGRLGPHPYKDGKSFEEQGLRHWLHRERWDDPRVLYNPLIGYRRQADIDDNGESYPGTYEGPDIWVGVRIPAGVHKIALYFFNKDGHDGANRLRDYIVDVKRGDENLLVSEDYPTLARARVRDFWGGQYKQFLLRGPGDYYFVVRKNNSFNTVLQAVLIDKLSGPPTEDEKRRDVWLGETHYEPPYEEDQGLDVEDALAAVSAEQRPYLQAAVDLWQALDHGYDQRGIQDLDLPGRLLAYRAADALIGQRKDGQPLLRDWRWKLPLWPQSDRDEFTESMKKAWDSLNKQFPEWKDSQH